ncbi:urea transporter [Marinobacterium aestuariivivens]|uniref:Urea transporter n=1 Tax=Marinobacterium aestuariivivens TaxID=1698799 RepID=A0ABW2A0H3_9GAMM
MDKPYSARYWLDALLHGFSQIFFQTSRCCGLLLLLAIGLESPFLLMAGLTGCIIAQFSAGLCGYEADRIRAGHYGYNGALIGLGLGTLLGLTPVSLLLVALFSVLSAPLMEWQIRRWSLPPYTSTFVLLSWCALAVAPLFPLAPATPLPTATSLELLPLPATAVIQGLGQVIFLTSPLPALLVLVALAWASRRDCASALAGALCGTLVATQLPVSGLDLQLGLYGFNGALAAIALAQRFGHQPLLILAGAALATLLQPLLSVAGVPAFTAPFMLSCWLICLLAESISPRQPQVP